MKFSSLPRIYCEHKITSSHLELDESNMHYIKNVLRLKSGAKLRIFNQYDGEFIAYAAGLDNKKNAHLVIDEKIRKLSANLNIKLAVGITKNDAMAAALSMAAQLGVCAVIPVATERSQRARINRERCEKILLDATRQSEGFIIPKLHSVTRLSDLLQDNKKNAVIFANENENNLYIKDLPGEVIKSDNIILLIGAEGGFTDAEMKMLNIASNVTSITLGMRVLKVETACACAISQLHQQIV